MKILITAPSLDENENVSGISTLVREIIEHGTADFHHFQAGRSDSEKISAKWILRQILLAPRFWLRIRRENVDVVHINTALVPLSIIRDAALTLAAGLAGRPVLLHPNGGRFLMEKFKSRPLALITEKMFRQASKVLVLSEHERESVARRWKNLDVRILPNAIAVDQTVSRKDDGGGRVIIFLGRIHESKGLHEIIEACRILKNENLQFRFDCFGAGPLKNFFITEMTKILGEKFYYGGVISGAKKWKQLARSDIFLLPSRYGEGLPLAMLEAMAAGCVPVTGDVASVRAVIEDGVNGFMVEPYNTSQVAEKLKILLSDKVDWKTLRRNARETIEEKFAISEYVRKLESLYAEIHVNRNNRNISVQNRNAGRNVELQ